MAHLGMFCPAPSGILTADSVYIVAVDLVATQVKIFFIRRKNKFVNSTG